MNSIATSPQVAASSAQTECSGLYYVGVGMGIVVSTALGAGINYLFARNHPNMLLGVLIGAFQGFSDATIGEIVDHYVEDKKQAKIIKSVSTFAISTISIVGLTALGLLTPNWAIVSGLFAAVFLAWGLYSALKPSTEAVAQEEVPQQPPELEFENIEG